jgi:FkbM family methyltransferase
MTIKSTLKKVLAHAGVHVTHIRENPQHTWLGLPAIPFNVIVDVGANEGQFAREARKKFPMSRIISFEPGPRAFARLKAWADQDGNAEAINMALGDSAGEVVLNLHPQHSESSSLLSTTPLSHELYPVTVQQQPVPVKVETLDTLFGSELQISGDVLLKLDVQGFEVKVLEGARQSLSKVRACIAEVCLDPLYEGQSSFEEIVELCGAAGLKYRGNVSQVYANDGHVIYLDALFLR